MFGAGTVNQHPLALTAPVSKTMELKTMERIVLGLINIGITAALFVLVGVVIVWILSWLGFAVPENVKKVYMILVALIILYQAVALIFGLPIVGLVHP